MNNPDILMGNKINSALFIDFDNVHITLQDFYGPNIAREFSMAPIKLLNWLEKKLPGYSHYSENSQRRILVRRCYLNPESFKNFRPHFVRAAFEVIDCPPLTKQQKTSSDIHMVMDILDVLNNEPHINEIIIASSDADFTPVIVRARKCGFYSVVLALGYVSPSYEAAFDYVIDTHQFLRDLFPNDFPDDIPPVPSEVTETRPKQTRLLHELSIRLQEIADRPGGIVANEIPDLFKERKDFPNSDWFGYKSLRTLIEQIVAVTPNLQINDAIDPWRVVKYHETKNTIEDDPNSRSPNIVVAKERNPIFYDIEKYIKNTISTSSVPISLAKLAHDLRSRFWECSKDGTWIESGSFKGLLNRLNLGQLQIDYNIAPGYIYHPELHKLSDVAYIQENSSNTESTYATKNDLFMEQYPDLAQFAWKIHSLTKMPYLMPQHYALLLKEIADQINQNSFHFTSTSKTVRDRCFEQAAPVARNHVNFILTSIRYTGHRFSEEGKESPQELGDKLVENTFNLCRMAQLELSPDDEGMIRKWLIGELSTEYN